MVAIEAFGQPKVVILGGSDKGADFSELAETVKKNNIKKAVLIGQTAPNIRAALERAGYRDTIDGGSTMESIVNTARQYAQNGDVVILSTACASFGLFKNYKDRGEQFKAVVSKLS
jgi:UDP-N-acetylmuramoylalanine--D-glutamate ligase